MKTVVDEGVSVRLVRALRARGVEVAPFSNGWKGLKNGVLLAEIKAAGYGAVVTCDQGLRYQQNLAQRQIGVVVLPWTRFDDLAPLIEAIELAISTVEIGGVRIVKRDGSLE